MSLRGKNTFQCIEDHYSNLSIVMLCPTYEDKFMRFRVLGFRFRINKRRFHSHEIQVELVIHAFHFEHTCDNLPSKRIVYFHTHCIECNISGDNVSTQLTRHTLKQYVVLQLETFISWWKLIRVIISLNQKSEPKSLQQFRIVHLRSSWFFMCSTGCAYIIEALSMLKLACVFSSNSSNVHTL